MCVTSEPTDGSESSPCQQTEVDGRFELALAPGPTYTISVSARGHWPQARRWTVQQPAALEFVLEPGGVVVQGKTVDATGGSVAGALVTLSAGSSQIVARGISDARGQFELHVPAGEVEVTASAPGYALARADLVAPARDARLVLAPGSALVGTVVRADTQEAVAGAMISARPRNGLLVSVAPARTGSDGRFRISGVTAGAYEVSARAEGLLSEPHFVRVDVASELETMVLEMQPAARVEARLLVGDAPCATGSVHLVGASAFQAPVELGDVFFPGVSPGRYAVRAFCEDGGFGQFELLVPVEGSVSPVWRTPPGYALRGRVVTASAQGAPNRPIQCMPSGGTGAGPPIPLPPCQSDSQGEFTCRGLRAGSYRCVARTSDATSGPMDVTLPSEQPIQLVLEALGTIRVTLADSLVGAAVVATDAKGFRRWARSAGGAEFVLDGLPLGAYDVGTAQSPEQAEVVLERDGHIVELRLAVEAAELSGRVIDDVGVPVVEAWVQPEMPGSDAVSLPPALTDADGYFSFSPIAVGAYFVNVTSSAGEASMVKIETGEPRVITLRSHGGIEGWVTASDGHPVKEFELSYTNGETLEVQRVSNQHGRWSVPWLPVGNWTVTVRAPAGMARQAVEVEPAARRELRLTLTSRDLEPRSAAAPPFAEDPTHLEPETPGG